MIFISFYINEIENIIEIKVPKIGINMKIKGFATASPSKWTLLKKKLKRVLYYALAVVVILSSIFIYWKYFYTYSTGYRAGLLQKFSHKGNIIKTYEGEMILSSIHKQFKCSYCIREILFFSNRLSFGSPVRYYSGSDGYSAL